MSKNDKNDKSLVEVLGAFIRDNNILDDIELILSVLPNNPESDGDDDE